MSAVFRVQLANPGEYSVLYNLLPGGWISEDGALNPDKYLALVTMHGTILVFWVLTAGLSGTFANFLIPLQMHNTSISLLSWIWLRKRKR